MIAHPVAGLAAALVAHLEVDAALLAAAVVDRALVHAALPLRLVLPVAAVVDPVAHPLRAEAHGAVAEAVQLRRVATQGRALCNDEQRLAGNSHARAHPNESISIHSPSSSRGGSFRLRFSNSICVLLKWVPLPLPSHISSRLRGHFLRGDWGGQAELESPINYRERA